MKKILTTLYLKIFFYIQILNTHAPTKKKIERFSTNPFMTIQLRKAIMHRSRRKTTLKKVAHLKHEIAIKNSTVLV